MSVHTPYQKHTWVTKEIIRREYLQNIEDGIYQEQQDAEAAETALENALEAEKQRARSSETTIQNNLTAEITRATAAEEEITQSIQDDLDDLSERISNEYTRATTAETAIQDSIDANCVKKTDKATDTTLGIVKPDGTTVTVDANGVLSATGSSVSPQDIGFGYGTCVTAAATTAKEATLTGYNLVENGYVSIKFSNAVPANSTLNINSKGAKPIYYHGGAITANIIGAGDLATFVYDGTNYNLVGVDNVSSQIQTLEDETSDIVNVLGAKNLLPNDLTTQVISGVTFTVNNDGSISASGTATDTIRLNINMSAKDISMHDNPNEKYILSGCPSGGGENKYSLFYSNSVDSAYSDYGDGVEFYPFDKETYPNQVVRGIIHSGQTFSNTVIKPMIRPASIKDDTYVPYAMTNQELTEKAPSNNFGTEVALTSGTDFTCPSKGIIVFGSHVAVVARILINSVAIDSIIITSTLSVTPTRSVRVFKGDIVNVSVASGILDRLIFIPTA